MKSWLKPLLILAGAGVASLAAWRLIAGRAPGCRNVVLLGDSTIGGTSLRSELQSLLGSCSTVTAASYTSKTTSYILDKTDEALAIRPTDLVVLAGVNDVQNHVSFDTITANLSAIYAKGKAAGARVIAVQILPWGSWPGGEAHIDDTQDINDWIAWSAGADLVVNTEAMGDGAGSLHPAFDDGHGLHPGAAGQRALAGMIKEQGF